jgi:hypothetical protein
MLSTIPFDYPAHFLADGLAGNVIRYGAILKDAGTGRIVGHMQESGVAQSLLSMVGSGIPTPLSLATDVINVGSGLYTAVQVGQLKAMMETLQSLQVATLGVSLVGVGVSVAGFLYMHKRFNSLDGKIDQLMDTVTTGFESQQKAALRTHMSRTKSLVQRARQAHALSDPRPEYDEVAGGLAEQAAYFEGEVAFMISAEGRINLELFWQLAQVLMLCNNVRIDCRMRTNELRHALAISETIATEYQNLFDPLTPVSFDKPSSEGLATVRVLRDATDAAASKPYLIDYLRTSRIDGGEYIASLEREKENPLLILKVT